MAGTADKLANSLDHPIFFTMVLAVVVAAWLAIFTWAAKAANMPGPASFFQHP